MGLISVSFLLQKLSKKTYCMSVPSKSTIVTKISDTLILDLLQKVNKHFQNWVDVYSFYVNVKKEGAKLVDTA